MNFDWLKDPVLGSDIVIQDLLVAVAIMLLGIILSIIFPRIMANSIANIFANIEESSILGRKRRKGEVSSERENIERRMKRTVAAPVRKGLIWFYLILFLVLAVYSMNIEMSTTFELFHRDYEVWRLLQTGVAFLMVLVLSVFALEPILRATIYSSLGKNTTKSNKYKLFRSLKVPVKVMVVIIGLYMALLISFSSDQLSPVRLVLDILVFTSILLLSYVVAQIVVTILEPQFRSEEKSQRDTGKAIGRAIKIAFYVLGAVAALLYIGISPVTLVGGGVVTGIVLGFGLQDTIANFAAGILIVMDKPFVIGDRIRIDWGGRETWGDVTDISLRSTWIKTPEEELIVIPNNAIASSQVWNYTRESPRMVLQFDVGISYDSDWRLAEKLILEILHKHPLVLNKPPPYVLMKDFGDSAQILTIWFWIPEARDRIIIKSDVLKKIKDAFDKNGVEIPYPYRTQVYKRDMPKPERLKEEYKSPIYLPSTGFRKFKIQHEAAVEVDRAGSVMLAPTSGSYTARYSAPIVMETAKKMGAAVVALYIKTPGGSAVEGQRALRIFNEVAKAYAVDIKLLYKEGDVLENILETVESESATIVVMGSTEETVLGRLAKRSVSNELLQHLSIPTMIIPISERTRALPPALAVEQEFKEGEVDFTSLGAMEELGPKVDEMEE
ncbi:MAG: mechanosensitive ion channel domain-containing protein [Thermoplasmatota archaeon]